MSDIRILGAFLVVWWLLQTRLLPRLGVPT